MQQQTDRSPVFASDEAVARWMALRAGRPPAQLIYLESTDSTNTRLKELALYGAEAWTAVVAEHQRFGRGRMGRSWQAPARAGLLVSLLADSPAGPWLTARSALAALAAVKKTCGVRLRIKWPNDLVAGLPDGSTRKLGGVLVEAAGPRSVVGLGLNADILEDEFPPDIRLVAGSLASVFGLRIDRAELLAAYFDEFSARASDAAGLRAEMIANSATIGSNVASCEGEHVLAVDIDDRMRLVVQSSRGLSTVTALCDEEAAPRPLNGARST